MEEGSPTFPLPITWVMQIRCPLLFTLIHTHTYTVEHLSVEREIQPAWIWRQRGESRHPSFIIIPIFSLSLLNWLPKHTKCIFKIIYEFSRGQRRAVDQHDVSRALFSPLFIVIVFFSTTRHKLGRLCKELVEKQESRLPNALLLLLFSFLSRRFVLSMSERIRSRSSPSRNYRDRKLSAHLSCRQLSWWFLSKR